MKKANDGLGIHKENHAKKQLTEISDDLELRKPRHSETFLVKTRCSLMLLSRHTSEPGLFFAEFCVYLTPNGRCSITKK